MRSKPALVVVLAVVAFCLPAYGATLVSYDADVNAHPFDGTGFTGGGGGQAVIHLGRKAWESSLAAGLAGFDTRHFADNRNLDVTGFHVKFTAHYAGGNNTDIPHAGIYIRISGGSHFNIFWWQTDNNIWTFKDNHPTSDKPVCCMALSVPGLDVTVGYHDYIFSLDPDAAEFEIIIDGNSVITLPTDPNTFTPSSTDWFGFSGFQGNGDGDDETFFVHSLSLHTGPVPEPASMTLLALSGFAMLRRKR